MSQSDQSDGDATGAQQEEPPRDVKCVTLSESSHGEARSGLMSATVDTTRDDAEFGVQILQDGSFVGLTSGTTWEGDEDFKTFHTLTADQAREIAEALETAADDAEEAEASAEESPDGFLQRLIG